MRFQYSLIGVHDIIKQTPYYKSMPTIDQKNRLIDRCNFVFHQIIVGNIKYKDVKKHFKEVHIHSNKFKAVLTFQYYVEIIDFLVELDLIGVNEFFEIDGYSKSFWLTKKALNYEIDKVGVLSNFMAKKLKDFRRKRYTHLLKSPIHSKQIKNLCELQFEGKKVDIAWKSTTQEKRYAATLSNLLRFNDYTTTDEYLIDESFFYTLSRYGRVYHYFSNVPKRYRKQLQHISGSRITEIDLKQAQVLLIALAYQEFLYLMYEKLGYREGDLMDLSGFFNVTSSITDDSDVPKFSLDYLSSFDKTAKSKWNYTDKTCQEVELCQILKDCLTGDVYETMKEYVPTMENYEYWDRELIYEYEDMERKDFKVKVIADCLFANHEYANKAAVKILDGKYPNFMNWMFLFKSHFGYEELSRQAQGRESTIFVDQLFSEIDNEWATTVHDAVICLSDDANMFNDLLVGLMQKNYPFVEPSLFENVFSKEEYKPN